MPELNAPRLYQGVMVSSTFTNLAEHRRAVIDAIKRHDLTEIAMENVGATAGADVIRSSLKMVRDGTAYVGVISHKYGQTPISPDQNPKELSITELEFNEALRLDRPIILFIMGDDHPVTKRDVEPDPEKALKLDEFRERAKRMREGSEVERVYEVFNSLEEFKTAAANAVGKLRRFLDEQNRAEVVPPVETETETETETEAKPDGDAVPSPPELFAVPRYAGSHAFVGRVSQLETLTDWASAADPHPVFLFSAIGGSGKSILTWEWMTQDALTARDDWAGRFWFSFYEKGGGMVEFCRYALAYMTGEPMDAIRKKKMPELADLLVAQLNARPWLLVLDGLERVLVAYNRFDAAQLRDEDADTAGDQIAERDPCAAIRTEDDELLRRLAAAAPSKLLLTSRLMPRALLNPSGHLPGVRWAPLPGMRPSDAEVMIRACGVTGTSETIRAYLQENCDCHPLVIGALAGLISDYLPDRGNFDKWAADPAYGGRLNLAELDLVARRNHILEAAFDALSGPSRQLLSTLALLYRAVDYETLCAFNPHLPANPEEVPNPDEAHAASLELDKTVLDLERRGLFQYDAREKRFDLHPVVRGVAAGRMRSEEKSTIGQQVVDHFAQQTHDPYEEAETLEDVTIGLQLVRGLLQIGRFQNAFFTLSGDLTDALLFNLEAHAEVLELLRPFFPEGWTTPVDALEEENFSYVSTVGAASLYSLERYDEADFLLGRCIDLDLRSKRWPNIFASLFNLSVSNKTQYRLAKAQRLSEYTRDIAEHIGEKYLFSVRLQIFNLLSDLGHIPEAAAEWRQLDTMARELDRSRYRPGDAESSFAEYLFKYGELRDEYLVTAEKLAREGRNRLVIRKLCTLRGRWHLKQGEFAPAVEKFREAVRMAREIGQEALGSEALLSLALLRAGEDGDAQMEAERLSAESDGTSLAIAELWHALGDRDNAVAHAHRSYRWAMADGEPYVYRYHLDQARALLEELGEEIPETPRYDATRDEPSPWENDLKAASDALRAQKLKEDANKN